MLPILAAVLAFITIGGLGWAFVGGGDSSDVALKRARALGTATTSSAARKVAAAQANTPEARRKQILIQLKDAERQERKARMTMAAKLTQAGLSMKIQMLSFLLNEKLQSLRLCLMFHETFQRKIVDFQLLEYHFQ